MPKSSRIKRVVMVAPRSTGGNFEYVAIPRQGLLFLSGALEQHQGDYLYEREILYEDRSGNIDPDKDLEGVDILMVTALINEAPRAYEIARDAKAHHPKIILLGGGPHMSPLAEEALKVADFDVVVQREGEDIIGPLCDTVLKYRGANLTAALSKIPGISFMDKGNFVQTERRGVISPDFVELPDFASVRDLTPQNPLAAGVMETVRGCTEKCTYCQVIQQFLGYRMIGRETEIKRLAQLRKMAEDGLIYTARDGRFSVFISDDLHPPVLRATKFRDERVARLRGWKGHSDGMWMICQTRAEIGQDPELAQAMLDAGIRMLYVGVESSNAKNLELVKKRQDINQVNTDLITINKMGFTVAAMTIIGLPFDTEESIMEMADWVKTVSRYQTANLLTPLPATINWKLTPLDEDGSILPEGKMRPYHLYTGRQFVHHDERWGMQESRELFDRYTARLHPVDTLYKRIFTLLKRSHGKADQGNDVDRLGVGASIGRIGSKTTRLRQSLSMTISGWEESIALTLRDRDSLGNMKVVELK
ncbi:MAG: radical SAM protein, partial [Chloroflexi bacterium]|nr:radical SAM protein [Chloroflexota bacterium]